MSGLFDHKRGRRQPVKVTDEVRSFILSELVRDAHLRPEELADRCARETGVHISRRTIYRVLAAAGGQKKKRRRARRRRSRG
jgi:transposase